MKDTATEWKQNCNLGEDAANQGWDAQPRTAEPEWVSCWGTVLRRERQKDNDDDDDDNNEQQQEDEEEEEEEEGGLVLILLFEFWFVVLGIKLKAWFTLF